MRKHKSVPAYIFSGVGIAYLGFLLIYYSVYISIFFPFYFSSSFGFFTSFSTFSLLLSDFSMYLIAFPLFMLIFKSFPSMHLSPPPNKKISIWLFLKLILPAIPISRLINYIYLQFLSLLKIDEDLLGTAFDGVHPIIVFITVSVIAPIMEELVFRKALYNKISAYGSRAYIFTSALFFGLFHMNVLQGTYASILGVFLAWLMYHTGKVIYPILGHFLFNLLGSGLPILLSLLSIPERKYILICDSIEYGFIGLGIIAGIFLAVDLAHKKISLHERGNLPVPASKEIVINIGYIAFFVITLSSIVLTELFVSLYTFLPDSLK